MRANSQHSRQKAAYLSEHTLSGFLKTRRKFSAALRCLLYSAHRRVAPLGNAGPFVSFSFDDFPRTAYTVGGSILRSFGVRGTYYVAMGLMNTSNALGDQFHMEDLCLAAKDGHELASHTFGHTSSHGIPLSRFLEDVRKGRRAITETGSFPATANFAYPRGEVTLSAKQAVGREMLSCRGIYGGFNGPLVDLNLLRANSLYGDIDRLNTVERLLRENQSRKSWLIFYTHDVRFNPSPYGCTPEFLESVVHLAVKGGAKVLPVAEVLTYGST